jgi:hypothetical protein
MSSAAGALILFLIVFSAIATFTVRLDISARAEQARKREKAQQTALQLNPVYRAKVGEDRAYQLAQEKLWLDREKQTRELELKSQELDLKGERQTVELEIIRNEFNLKYYLARTRATPETYIINEEPRSITALPSLKRSQEEKVSPYDHLLQAQIAPPTEDYLLSQIKENSYTVSPGVRASNGDPVLVDITAVPHGKLIGSSGFGKSTCMYIMLRQAAETNNPRRLQLCLLDLEHKTSRLLEDYPHVATFRVGKRLIQMVATNADMVAEYLGYLKLELDRRTQLSEAKLMRNPALLIYVEEMLSLQYEVVDPRLLQIIFHSLTIISVRGKKYGMFLYACMQTDYSTDELKISQKMFRFRGAASVDVSAARAAGFQNTELIKHNFQNGKAGQLVIEYPSFSDLVIVPAVELKRLLAKKTGAGESFGEVSEAFSELSDSGNEGLIPDLKASRNTVESTLKTTESAVEARFQEVRKLWLKHWGKGAIIQKVWNVKAGGSKAYKEAEQEYNRIVEQLERIA